MLLTSPSFEHGAAIPKKFGCDGEGINPELQIHNVPTGTKSLALMVYDPDAPRDGGFMHWLVWNINPVTTLIKEESVPPGSTEGVNDAGENSYAPPCPPSGIHRYYFRLYALDAMLSLPVLSGRSVLENEIGSHLLAEAELLGTYAKQSG